MNQFSQQASIPQVMLSQNTPVIAGCDNSPRLRTYPEQEIILVADDSGSMSGAKASELNQACQKLITELNDPKNKDGFRLSVVRFGSDAYVEESAVPPANTTIAFSGSSGGTNAASGLSLAKMEIENFMPRADRRKTNPVIIFMSDGYLDDADKAINLAEELKSKYQATIIAIGFGSDADSEALKKIASSHQHYAEAEVGTLAKLFAHVGKTVTNSLQQA